MKIGALSGSLTKLLDGTSYLVAGTNITITTGSNEAVTIDATGGGGSPGGFDTHVQYNNGGAFDGVAEFTYDATTLQLTGSLIQANNGTNTVGFMGNLSAASPLTIGTDVFFFVSGSRDVEVSVFGGDLIVSGAMTIGGPAAIEGDSLEVTGTITATQGFSGSLTTLSDGTSYIIAGNNISIVSASNGAITIGALPGGSDTEIQYNGSGAFTGSNTFTFNGTTVYLTGSLANGDASVTHGSYSHAEGTNTNAYGYSSHAEGYFTSAGAAYAHAEGSASQAYGQGAHGEGSSTSAAGVASHSEGVSSISYSDYSHAEGSLAIAGYRGFETVDIIAGLVTINAIYGDVTTSFNGSSFVLITLSTALNDTAYEIAGVNYSAPNTLVTLVDTTVGDPRPGLIGVRGVASPTSANKTSSGISAHAEGYQTHAQPRFSHAEGYQTKALAERSHAEGVSTTTIGVGSHSEGLGTIASGSYQHVGGKYNVRNNDFSLFVVGNGTSDADVDRSDVLRVNSGSVGDGRVEVTGSLVATMGLSGSLTTLADGTSYLIAGTNLTITSASNGAVTIDATATSPGGSDTEIQYNSGGSFAGSSNFTYNGTTVFLTGSFSQGNAAVTSGIESHAEGFQTTASGDYSHAEGRATTASGDFSHAEGATGTTASGDFSHAEGDGSVASGIASHAEGDNTLARGQYSHAEGYGSISSGSYSHAEGIGTNAIAEYSHAEGFYTYAGSHALQVTSIINGVISIDSSHGDVSAFFSAGGYAVVVDAGSYSSGQSFQIATSAHAGFTQVTLVDTTVNDTSPTLVAAEGYPGIASDYSIGSAAHSEGISTNALGLYSHAEGAGAIAVGLASHAEGQQSVARGQYSHAEGSNSQALGEGSHAEGNATVASGSYSHAEGQETIASGSYQHVGGKYNTRGNNFSLFVVGNGTSDLDTDRSDILRVNTDSVQVSGSLIVSGAYILNVVSGTTSPTYTIGAWDHVVVFTDNVVTATLPSSSPIGRKITFKDGTGAASTAGGQMLSCSLGIIDGAATYTMASVDYTAVSVVKINDPDEWIVV